MSHPKPPRDYDNTEDGPLFVSTASQLTSASADKAVIRRSRAGDIYGQISPGNVSIRDSMRRDDYNEYRPGERVPTKPKEVIAACMRAYDHIGIVRNIVDLMSDFATQGIDLCHPDERTERFYKNWFQTVEGPERSERFLNLLYRGGTTIVRRQTAQLSIQRRREYMRTKAEDGPDLEIEPDVQPQRAEVPWRYIFMNPLAVDVIDPEMAMFLSSDKFQYKIKVPRSLINRITHPSSEHDLQMRSAMPPEVVRALRNGNTTIPLPADKVRGFYYKRDDWQAWGKPMIQPILKDLNLLEKMKLADLAALDGAMSCIRVWKLGNMDHQLYPTDVAINRLATMLMNNVGGGVMDLVWGPEIELLETSTDVHRFLGDTKYAPTLTAIYAGLGVPPTLTGAASEKGFTNNSVSLKTLVERLQYGRAVLKSFWREELRLVQKAMGFSEPAKVVFDRMTLTDEAAEKQLLINLADRDLISVETLQERFGEIPEIEQVRQNREQRSRNEGRLPEKAGPFHNAEKSHELTRQFVQQGEVTPSEVGLELQPRKEGEVSPAERQAELQKQKGAGGDPPAPKGQPGQGRPKNKKDTQKRKQKQVNPKASAEFITVSRWATSTQEELGRIVFPRYLASLEKKSGRELTQAQVKEFERFKFHLLCQFRPGDTINEDGVKAALNSRLPVLELLNQVIASAVTKYVEQHGTEPSVEDMRRFYSMAYAVGEVNFEEE